MTSDSTPTIREAVRVLLLDERERLLLFRFRRETGGTVWFPAGGGIEDGEEIEDTARREVAEETSLRELELGPEVWRRRHFFVFRGEQFDQRERWFIARVRSFAVDVSGQTEEERAQLSEWRWWTLAQLQTTSEVLVPADLARLLGELLEDGPPPQPIEVGI